MMPRVTLKGTENTIQVYRYLLLVKNVKFNNDVEYYNNDMIDDKHMFQYMI